MSDTTAAAKAMERARELLACAYERDGYPGVAAWIRTDPITANSQYGVAIDAIVSALASEQRVKALEADLAEVKGVFTKMLADERWKAAKEMREIVGGDEIGDYDTVLWRARRDVDAALTRTDDAGS